MNAGEDLAAKYDLIPVLKDKADLGSEKWEMMNAGLKTGEKSASPNVTRLKESTTPMETP